MYQSEEKGSASEKSYLPKYLKPYCLTHSCFLCSGAPPGKAAKNTGSYCYVVAKHHQNWPGAAEAVPAYYHWMALLLQEKFEGVLESPFQLDALKIEVSLGQCSRAAQGSFIL